MQKFSFFGIFLIVVGAFLLLRNVLDLDIPFWDFFFPILLILWGVSMLVNNITRSAKAKKS
jgi:predicted membrane protein